jgi:hypothetical protein
VIQCGLDYVGQLAHFPKQGYTGSAQVMPVPVRDARQLLDDFGFPIPIAQLAPTRSTKDKGGGL